MLVPPLISLPVSHRGTEENATPGVTRSGFASSPPRELHHPITSAAVGVPGCARRADFLHQMVVHEGTLLDRASHGLALVSFLVPELDDHAACAFVLAGLVALGQPPPGAYGILPCRGLSLAAAMRVVDRIHRDAAHGGPHAAPADAPGLADRFEAVLLVADLADRRAAIDVHFANLPGTQAHLGVAALAC